jgi:hypothetical protein
MRVLSTEERAMKLNRLDLQVSDVQAAEIGDTVIGGN